MILNFINLSRLKDWRIILPLSPLTAPTFILDLNLDYSSSKKHQRIYLNIFLHGGQSSVLTKGNYTETLTRGPLVWRGKCLLHD